jgi:hypothetical protein
LLSNTKIDARLCIPAVGKSLPPGAAIRYDQDAVPALICPPVIGFQADRLL